MKSFRLGMMIGGTALVGWALVTACGGDSEGVANNNAGNQDAASGSDSANSSSGNPGSSSGDPGGGNDAGTDTGASSSSSSGGPSNPGQINCGATVCQQGQICCVRLDGGTCVANTTSCSDGVNVVCDEAADCPANQKCCANLTTRSASCAASCPPYGQLCKTQPECGDAGACSTKTCANPDNPSQSIQIRTCGAPIPIVCQ